MPLLNDAKTCYVGTTPITTIMAGSVKVWPKVEPLPTQIKTDSGGMFQGQYVTWEYTFTDCVSLTNDWSVRSGYEVSPGSITWQPWQPLVYFDTTYWFYSPDHKRLAWTTLLTLSNEWDGLALRMWYQARDNRTGQTIINEKFDPAAPSVIRPSNTVDCSNALPIDPVISATIPGDEKRSWVTWDNAFSTTNCIDLRNYNTRIGFSDSADGSTQPSVWNPAVSLDKAPYKMIWPTYNAILWSPFETDLEPEWLQRAWYWVVYGVGTSNTILPPTQMQINPPSYPYPSGDGITC